MRSFLMPMAFDIQNEQKTGALLAGMGLTFLVVASIGYVLDQRSFALLTLIAALSSASAGIYLIGHHYFQKLRLRYLLSKGVRVQATVTSVHKARNLAHKGHVPYVIVAQWKDTRTQKTFVATSEAIWQEFTPVLLSTNVEIFHHPRNPLIHHMKLENFLPMKRPSQSA